MSDTTQIHEIYFMSEDKNKKMVMLNDYLESLSDIHKLKKRIAELEAQVQKWISVEDELPEQLVEVIVLVRGDQVFAYYEDGCWFNDDTGQVIGYAKHNNGYLEEIIGVTHWMPIPQPPKEQSK